MPEAFVIDFERHADGELISLAEVDVELDVGGGADDDGIGMRDHGAARVRAAIGEARLGGVEVLVEFLDLGIAARRWPWSTSC